MRQQRDIRSWCPVSGELAKSQPTWPYRDANQKAIEAEGLSFILGMKIPDVPYQVAQ
jgi:hypothetical protein